MLGDIGFPELMVILLIALILFGGGKLPEVGRSLGNAVREFKKAMKEAGAIEKKKLTAKAPDEEPQPGDVPPNAA